MAISDVIGDLSCKVLASGVRPHQTAYGCVSMLSLKRLSATRKAISSSVIALLQAHSSERGALAHVHSSALHCPCSAWQAHHLRPTNERSVSCLLPVAGICAQIARELACCVKSCRRSVASDGGEWSMKKPPRYLSWLAFGFASWLGACAPADAPVQDAHAHRLEGDGNSVTVIDAGDEAHARPYAEQYCDAIGRSAQFRGMSKHRHSRYAFANDVEFDCVLPK